MRTKVTGYLTQKRGFYYVVLNMPSDIKGKRIRKNIKYRFIHCAKHDKGQRSYARNDSGSQAGEEVHGVMERRPCRAPRRRVVLLARILLFSDYLQFWLQWKRSQWEKLPIRVILPM